MCLRDFLYAILLAGAVAAVYGLDRLNTPVPEVSPGDADAEEIVPPVVVPPAFDPKPLELGVTPAQFDDMGKLLEMLGKGYGYSPLPLERLTQADRLSQFDVIFLTSGTVRESWLGEAVGKGARDSTLHEMNPEVAQNLKESLSGFVQNGGTLYASDWRYSLLRLAFPEITKHLDENELGDKQAVDAYVADPGLQELLGAKSIKLNFDMPSWNPAAFEKKEITSLLNGRYVAMNGDMVESPLLVKMPFGEGTLVFTSFHNEKQNSKIELELLKYLVFTTVTARAESETAKVMVEGGFSPKKRNLLSASADAPSVTKTYDCTKRGRLQFALAFENQGARLRLTVIAPDGKRLEKEGVSAFTIDVADSQIGKWQYVVTALEIPYENFAYTVSVWEK